MLNVNRVGVLDVSFGVGTEPSLLNEKCIPNRLTIFWVPPVISKDLRVI